MDWFAGRWVASNARFAIGFHQAADARYDEYPVLIGFLDCRVRQVFQERRGSLVIRPNLLRQVTDDLGLGHACHLSSLTCEYVRALQFVYYMRDEFVQAFSLDFMRVFCSRAVENCMNSGDGWVAGFQPQRARRFTKEGGRSRWFGLLRVPSCPLWFQGCCGTDSRP